MNRADWPREALRRAADKVRQAGPGTRHDTLRAQSMTLAPYVSHGLLSAQDVQASLLEAAGAAGVDGSRRGEAVRTILSGLDKGAGGEAWMPDEAGTGPQKTTATWKGKLYSITGGRVTSVKGLGRTPVPVADAGATMAVTLFPRLQETQGVEETWTWDDLREACREPHPWPEEGKDALPLWSWCLYEGASRARRPDGLHPDGRERTRDAAIEGVGALVLDYDDDPEWSVEQTERWWGEVRYVAHTTAHHQRPKATHGGAEKPAQPRGRVIVALSRVVLEEEWADLVLWVLSSGRGRPGETELRSARRAYYVPADLEGYAWSEGTSDRALDVDACLAEAREVSDALDEAEAALEPDEDLVRGLPRSRTGDLRDTILTLSLILDGDARWQGRLRWSEFSDQPELDGHTLTDEAETEAAGWLENVYGIKSSTTRVHEVMRAVARRHPYHPVRTYLDGVTWDGVPRLDSWLLDYTGCSSALAPVYGRCWLISAVARIYSPGCKVDTVPILRGPQGAQKSTLISALAGPGWSRDSALSIGDKDGYQQLRGVWLYELGELDSVSRREWSTVKAFISSQVDEYRPSYGRNTIRVPRQVVFVGTTNEASFLGDSTGSRRFWVIEVQDINVEGLRRIRDQMWAEAVHRYRHGEPWWLSAEEEEVRHIEAGAYESSDPWAEQVSAWLVGRQACTVAEVAISAVGRRLEDLNGADEKRIVKLLSLIGWIRKRRGPMVNGRRQPWVWAPR